MERTQTTQISMPELFMVAGTRAALGFGLGLLLAERFKGKRRTVGWTLFGMSALITIPLAFEVLGGRTLSGKRALRKVEAA